MSTRTNLQSSRSLVIPILFLLCCQAGCAGPPIHPIRVKQPVSLLELVNRDEVKKIVEPPGEVERYVHVVEVTLGSETSRALFLHPSSKIIFPLRIDEPGLFETAVALIPEAWEKGSDGVTFYVAVRRESDPIPTYHVTYYLDPLFWEDSPEWRIVQVDLTPYKGENIELILGTEPGPKHNPLYDWAVWKEPRIYDPTENKKGPAASRRGE